MAEVKKSIGDQEVRAALIQLIEGGKTLDELEGLSDDMRSRISELLNQIAGRKISGIELDSSLLRAQFKSEVRMFSGYSLDGNRCLYLDIEWEATTYANKHKVFVVVKNTETGEEREFFVGRGGGGAPTICLKNVKFPIDNIRFYRVK